MRKRPMLAGLFISVIIVATCLFWLKVTFVSGKIKRRTGATQVRALDEFHSSNQWYGKAEITPQTGKQLRTRYEWKRGFKKDVPLAGKIVSERLSNSSECFYRIEQDTHDLNYHPYNCTAYVLSPDMKMLEIYETFGS